MRGILETTVDGGVPDELPVGRGTCAVLRGWCRSPGARVRSIRVFLDGREQTHAGLLPRPRQSGFGYRWWAVIVADPVERPRRVTVELEARVGWRQRVRQELGTMCLVPGWVPPQLDFEDAALRADGSITGALSLRPKVAVCTAIHNANGDEFRAFCDTLTAQTYENWLCVICDLSSGDRERLPVATGDQSRFVLVEAADGSVYDGLEHALMQAPADAPYIVLADPRQHWEPGTLQSLLDGLEPESNAVAPLRSTAQKPNAMSMRRSLRSRERKRVTLILGRGSATGPILFRRELLRYVLPFLPAECAASRPHGWIEVIAGSLGDVSYRPILVRDRPEPSGYRDQRTSRLPDATDRSRLRHARPQLRINQQIQSTVVSRALEMRCGALLPHAGRP